MKPAYWLLLKKNMSLLSEVRAALGLPYCTECPSALCGGTCCPDSQQCVCDAKSADKCVCCDPNNVQPRGNCCPVYSTKSGQCCDSGQVLDQDGDCATQCGVTTCKAGSTCVGIQNYDSAGNKTDINYYCSSGDKKCGFSDFEYDPMRIPDRNGNKMPLCKHIEDAGSVGPFLYCKSPDIVNYTMSASDRADNPSMCTVGDALSRTADTGRISASWDPVTGKASEIISCIASKVGQPCPDSCPGEDPNQCCRDANNALTGTICPTNQRCWLNPLSDRHECALGFKYGLDPSSNKWVCQAATNTGEIVYKSIDECTSALKDSVGHPACLGDNTRGISKYPKAWVMRNGVCYRNIPLIASNSGTTNMDCSVPGRTSGESETRLATETYNRGDSWYCADQIDNTPIGNMWCAQWDTGSIPTWIQCSTPGGCPITDTDTPQTTSWMNHRYYYNPVGGKMATCVVPPPDS